MTGQYFPSSRNRVARAIALTLFVAIAGTAACYPIDTGAADAKIAVMQMDEELYTLRLEASILQEQIDSLANVVRRQDSLLRWVANQTGNPISDPIRYIPPPQ